MSLKVTSGIFKGRKLRSMPGKSFRPLSERIKQALFSIISDKVPDAKFLDLFAGVGNVGLEALSRGALHVVFVEKDTARLKLIESNIEHLGAELTTEVIKCDVFNYKSRARYDIIFAGPPYLANLGSSILKHIKAQCFLNDGALLILQRHYKEDVDFSGYEKTDERKYGITLLDFYKLSY